jgi:transcriptional regulator with XRE-family HTH domain
MNQMNSAKTAEFNNVFGMHLTRVRTTAGLSILQLAETSDVGYSHIEEIEHGIGNPTISTVRRLALAMKIEPWELFNFTIS